MPNYKEMYYELFNKITDVIGELQEVQQKVEEMYMNSDEPKIIELNRQITDEESLKNKYS